MAGARPGANPAALAKGALLRLAQSQREPTPENFARAYAEESGRGAEPAADAQAAAKVWAQMIERLAKNLERVGRQWTAARRKDSLQRVIAGSRSDPARLQQRLLSLMGTWESDQALDPSDTGFADPSLALDEESESTDAFPWSQMVSGLSGTVQAALPAVDPLAAELAQRLGRVADAIAADGARADHVQAVAELCVQARSLLGHGHRMVEQLTQLCRELGEGMAELSEDDSWSKGQCLQLQQTLDGDMSLRGLRSAATLLSQTRRHQQGLQGARRAARESLQQLIHDMLLEVGELDSHTGRFQQVTAAHAQAIEGASSIEGLAEVVKAMLEDTRAVQTAVARSQDKLQADHAQAQAMQARVRELEAELTRLSDEVSTDLLTQVANRRGLMQAFEAESARSQREGGSALAVALIDIDNFKKLNDSLGHAAGDVALKTLAAAVRERLRPVDHLARFGGEEFVVLLPGTGVDEASQALTRLQRSLSEALFLHDGREVFVTFSAGVTAWRPGEELQPALERADEALYEAKRTGKNRTCAA